MEPQPSLTFAPAKKCVKPLKGPPINNVFGFMACHLELNYAEVSKFIYHYFLPAVNFHVCFNGSLYWSTPFVNGGHVNGNHC